MMSAIFKMLLSTADQIEKRRKCMLVGSRSTYNNSRILFLDGERKICEVSKLLILSFFYIITNRKKLIFCCFYFHNSQRILDKKSNWNFLQHLNLRLLFSYNILLIKYMKIIMVLVPDVSSGGEKLNNYYQKRSPRVFVSEICWRNFEAWISKVI